MLVALMVTYALLKKPDPQKLLAVE
jgi:hypothetical protein